MSRPFVWRRPSPRRPVPHVVEDVAFLLEVDGRMPAQQLGWRLGTTPNTIQTALRRGDRRDLLDRLARNAERVDVLS